MCTCLLYWSSGGGGYPILLFDIVFLYSNCPPLSLCSSSASPESGLGTSHTSLPGSGGVHDPAIAEEMYYEAEPLQPLGTCKALYTFEGE